MKKVCYKQNFVNLVILGLAVTAASLESYIATPLQYGYAYPSAMIAGLFLGVSPILTDQHEVLMLMINQWINVTSKCSAFGFSCLLCAILVINILKFRDRMKMYMGLILVLPAAYLITIFVNGCRIVGGYYAYQIGGKILPSNFQSAIHLGVGITFFLSTLIGITLMFERINHAD